MKNVLESINSHHIKTKIDKFYDDRYEDRSIISSQEFMNRPRTVESRQRARTATVIAQIQNNKSVYPSPTKS